MSGNPSGKPEQVVRKSNKHARKLGTLEQLEGRCLLNARMESGVWVISGDDRPDDPADVIIVDRDPARPANLRATVNGTVIDTRPERRMRGIRINAGAGADTVIIDESAGRISKPVTVNGGAGNDQIQTGSGRDVLEGGTGLDTLQGGDGDDRLRGGNDRNRLEGEGGADNLRGGPDNDTLWGGDGADRLEGLGGRDRMQGGDGEDTMLGGQDDDTLIGNGDDPASGAGETAVLAATSADEEDDDDDLLDGGSGDNVLVGSGGEDVLENGRAPESLETLTSCSDVGQRLAEQAQNQFNWFFDGGWGGIGRPGLVFPLAGDALNRFEVSLASTPGAGADGGGEAPSFSETNNQEVGVDEADIVKTDGNYMYVLRGSELILVDAWPAETASIVSRTEIEGYAIDMFLRGNRAMIFSSVFVQDGDPEPVPPEVEPVNSARLIAPGWYGGGQQTVKVTVFDVSDPTAPELVHESYLDGSYINSRMIDGQVYIVMNNSPQFPSPWILWAEDGATVESPDGFKERLAAIDPNSFIPQYRSVDYTESGVVERTGGLLLDCEGVYKTSADDWMNLTTVLFFNLDGETVGGPLDSTTVFGYVNTVYASAQNLYLINQNWQDSGPVSGIHKISLGADIQLQASGEVRGSILNQFSVDEHDSYLRVATTSQGDQNGRWNTENNVYILSQEGDVMNVVGSVEDLASGEQIYSARFFDDHGFVVTFRQVDPLFALDLTDPTDPEVKGVLKVPGYSSYLHPVGNDHLLAIGRDADQDGRIRGLQVSLFNVEDLNNPLQVDTHLIAPEGVWLWSAAEWDPHAFAYFPESGVLSVPVDGTVMLPAVDDGDPDTFDWPTWEYHSKFWVFQVDLASGFNVLGQIDHDSTALRSTRIDQMLYTLAYNDIKVQPLLDPTSIVTQVRLDQS